MDIKTTKAIFIEKHFLDGGSTYPALLTVEDGEQYVVKVFTPKQESQGQATSKEFVANYLTAQFDLKAPEARLVYLDRKMIQHIEQALKEAGKIRDALQEGWYFGSRFIGNSVGLNGDHSFLDLYEVQNILAFDVLVQNTDRAKNHKPNLILVADGTETHQIYLIDHELCFVACQNPKFGPKNVLWNPRGNHIFLNTVLSAEEQPDFSEFEDNLRQLNTSLIDEVLIQLEEYGVRTDTTISAYLKAQKYNASSFTHQLYASLS